jgi:hypothetical protein
MARANRPYHTIATIAVELGIAIGLVAILAVLFQAVS